MLSGRLFVAGSVPKISRAVNVEDHKPYARGHVEVEPGSATDLGLD